MVDIIKSLGAWGVPTAVITSIVVIFIFMQITGEIITWCGKVPPELFKVRNYFRRKKAEREAKDQLLIDLKASLTEFTNKSKNWDNWVNNVDADMQRVHNQSKTYDASIDRLSKEVNSAIAALKENTNLTEELFIQSSRDRIIDFASRAGDYQLVISREEFKRIFKVYDRYEEFLAARGRENGEIEMNYNIIEEGYEYRTRHHLFLEDVRGTVSKK